MDNLNQSLSKKAEEARDQLDAHVREIVQWHFSPETGAPHFGWNLQKRSILIPARK